MTLVAGTRFGPYEILGALGAGGMGEVYKARDTRLDRTVALKILPSSDDERRQRFAREAKAIAALSHPNICTLHDVGHQDGTDFLVVEYLEGETLADRLRAGPLDLPWLLELAIQIADAIDTAHAAHVVHRDLKPHNIIITQRGQAKVLDFGLAKTGVPQSGAGNARSDLPTLANRGLTSPGTTLGTISYMAPEQARGDDTDHRADLFSFGAVLYEMATGRPAFPGHTPAVIFDSILNRKPVAPGTLNPQIPSALDDIILRALEKDRDRRYQTAAEMRADLVRLRDDPSRRPIRPPSPGRRRRLGVAVAAGVVLLIALGLTAWRSSIPRAGGGPIDSIAVLPFVNASGTPDADYLSEGIADTLTNNLAQIRGLRVVPRTLAARYRNQNVDPRDAGVTLNARAVVTGRVMQRGDRLTVQAELIDVAGVAQLWGDQFDRPLSDVLAVQADISRAIADNLRLHLTREDERGLTAGAPNDAVAYQLYLKGRHETNRRTREGYAAAAKFFDQAIARDASYARAYAGLADVYLWQAYWGYLPAADTYPKALTAADKAVALDNRSADAHASLGWLNLYYKWNWTESAREYERALSLDETNAAIRAWYGESLSVRGRHDEAIAEIRRAIALDPLSSQHMTSLGFVLTNARRFDESIAVLKGTVEKGMTLAELDLARAYRLSGNADLAIAASRRMAETGDPLGPTFLAASYARAGRRGEAFAVLGPLESNARRLHRGGYLVAIVYAALGDRDAAFRWLEQAYNEHDTFLPWLNVDPEFDKLHGDPRFDDLVRRIGIPSH
jgi:serine/threonine protein kinase/tetratricopeptide (TPR) repeat protein